MIAAQFTSANELIPYSTATQMAIAFESAKAKIEEAQRLVQEANEELNRVFQIDSNYSRFDAEVTHGRLSTQTNKVDKSYKQLAWRHLIEKLGIQKVMSSSRADELKEVLYTHKLELTESLPDITSETIQSVIEGYCGSSEEFLQELVNEEYDFWKGGDRKLKTSQKNLYKLDKKLIRKIVDYCKFTNRIRVCFHWGQHITSIDNIFHLLDGKGAVQGYYGPLADAINSGIWEGETDYFKYKCCKNGNLHLEFKRQDLLDRFNQICGRNRIGN